MKHELKPCPFCGSYDVHITCEFGFCNADRKIFVACSACRSQSSAFQDKCNPDGHIYHHDVVQQAVDAWNRRVSND